MNKIVEVKLWGTLIGFIGYPPNSNITTFEYSDEFIKSDIFLSPLLMKYPPTIFSFEDISFKTFKGLAGIFADSIPDKFGNQLIDQFMAEKNIPQEEITSIDRLLYVGNRGMGAIEYHPYEFAEDFKNEGALDIHLLAQLAEIVLDKKKTLNQKLNNVQTRQDALNLIKIGSSAGGARSKALVCRKNDGKLYDGTILYNEECTYWLLKFDSGSNKDKDKEDPKGMTKVEYIYGIIAKNCGINIPRIDYIEDGDDFHFMIERFDRINHNNKTTKLHYISWAGLSHYDRDTTGAYSYEQLLLNAKQIGLKQDSITEIFKRAVFNIVGKNHDDHTKNFGFLMDRNGTWELSPAFDMTYSYDPTGAWTKVHQIKFNRKQDNFTKEDIIEFGKLCNFSEEKSIKLLQNTINQFSEFESLATKYKVEIKLKETIVNNLLLKINQ